QVAAGHNAGPRSLTAIKRDGGVIQREHRSVLGLDIDATAVWRPEPLTVDEVGGDRAVDNRHRGYAEDPAALAAATPLGCRGSHVLGNRAPDEGQGASGAVDPSASTWKLNFPADSQVFIQPVGLIT